MTRLMKALALCGCVLAGPALAAPISYGALSSNDDGSTEVIKDSLNNLEWLRWDILADLGYVETLAAIGSGGAYEGWKIADNQKAQDFTDAALFGQSNACTTSGNADCAFNLAVDFDALVGDNNLSAFTSAWFLSDNGVGEEVGFIDWYLQSSALGDEFLRKWNEGGSKPGSDAHSINGGRPSITWLLYREVPQVPVPAALPLMLAGLGAFAALSRRKRK